VSLNIAQCVEWRKLHNEELNDLYSLPNIVQVVKSRRMRWAGHVARMGAEGFDGVVVSMLASGTQDRGFEAVRFFRRKNRQHAFLRRGSKAVCPMSQICGMLKDHAIYVEVGTAGQIDWPFLTQFSPSLTEVPHVA
jgi:hypothetical protein